jgi:hypothetical protein
MAAPSLFKERSPAPSGEPGPACANCSAPLAVGQNWCLECGTAVPGRLRTAPGLRSSLGVVGVTLLLVVGAVAAVYAAASSDSKQVTPTTASVPGQTPVASDVPGAVTPAPGTALPAPGLPAATPTTKLPTAPKLPAATPTPTATAPVTVAPTTSTPKTTTPTTTVKPKTTTTTPTTSAPSATSAKIVLDTDAATTYNPYSLPPGGFGDPAKAIDGDGQTAWTYQLDSSTAGKTLVGLAINLKSKQTVRSITIGTPSPGMTVEFYGATGSELPVSITDPGWAHLATRTAISGQTTVELRSAAKGVHYLLVWITHAPSGVTTGTLGVSELSVSS